MHEVQGGESLARADVADLGHEVALGDGATILELVGDERCVGGGHPVAHAVLVALGVLDPLAVADEVAQQRALAIPGGVGAFFFEAEELDRDGALLGPDDNAGAEGGVSGTPDELPHCAWNFEAGRHLLVPGVTSFERRGGEPCQTPGFSASEFGRLVGPPGKSQNLPTPATPVTISRREAECHTLTS